MYTSRGVSRQPPRRQTASGSGREHSVVVPPPQFARLKGNDLPGAGRGSAGNVAADLPGMAPDFKAVPALQKLSSAAMRLRPQSACASASSQRAASGPPVALLRGATAHGPITDGLEEVGSTPLDLPQVRILEAQIPDRHTLRPASGPRRLSESDRPAGPGSVSLQSHADAARDSGTGLPTFTAGMLVSGRHRDSGTSRDHACPRPPIPSALQAHNLALAAPLSARMARLSSSSRRSPCDEISSLAGPSQSTAARDSVPFDLAGLTEPRRPRELPAPRAESAPAACLAGPHGTDSCSPKAPATRGGLREASDSCATSRTAQASQSPPHCPKAATLKAPQRTAAQLPGPSVEDPSGNGASVVPTPTDNLRTATSRDAGPVRSQLAGDAQAEGGAVSRHDMDDGFVEGVLLGTENLPVVGALGVLVLPRGPHLEAGERVDDLVHFDGTFGGWEEEAVVDSCAAAARLYDLDVRERGLANYAKKRTCARRQSPEVQAKVEALSAEAEPNPLQGPSLRQLLHEPKRRDECPVCANEWQRAMEQVRSAAPNEGPAAHVGGRRRSHRGKMHSVHCCWTWFQENQMERLCALRFESDGTPRLSPGVLNKVLPPAMMDVCQHWRQSRGRVDREQSAAERLAKGEPACGEQVGLSLRA